MIVQLSDSGSRALQKVRLGFGSLNPYRTSCELKKIHLSRSFIFPALEFVEDLRGQIA